MRFMNLPEEYCKKDSKFVILPIKYEKNLTFGTGTSKGPDEILKSSEHLEYYEDQFDCEPFEDGILTIKPLDISHLNPEDAKKEIKKLIPQNKFLITLGGDHSITFPIVEKLLEEQDFSVLIFDAHSDMRHSWNNSKLNHACVSKRISEKTNLGIVGVRAQDIDEKIEIDDHKDVHVIKAYNFSDNSFEKLLSKLKKKVYISIDVDVFDPSFIRNTGTPEPGGLNWNIIISCLKQTFKEKEVIAADIVEFSPKENFEAESYSLARLTYKLLALKKTS